MNERHDVVFVIDLVGFEVQMRYFGQLLELCAVGDVLDQVVRQVESHELDTVLEALHDANLVVREVQDCQLREVEKALDAWDLILMKVQALHALHVVHA